MVKEAIIVLHLDVSSTLDQLAMTTRFHLAAALLPLVELSSVTYSMVELVSTIAQWQEPLPLLMMTVLTSIPNISWMC